LFLVAEEGVTWLGKFGGEEFRVVADVNNRGDVRVNARGRAEEVREEEKGDAR